MDDLLLSVRGDARQIVAPDHALMHTSIRLYRDSKAEALRDAASAQESVIAALVALGAVVLAADTERQPLTWSAQSASTHDDWDDGMGRRRSTKRVMADVTLMIGIRDLALLDRVGSVLAAQQDLEVHGVSWLVDPDNPAWPQVRAAAIHAALAKGRDYAAALGGAVVRVEHVADVGLLGGDADGGWRRQAGARALARSSFDLGFAGSGTGPDSPSLDPVPQELLATIEARFVASVPAAPTG